MEKYFNRRLCISVQGASLVMTQMMCQEIKPGAKNFAGGAEYRLLFLQQGSALCAHAQMHAGDVVLLKPGQTLQCRFFSESVLYGIGFCGSDAGRLYGMVCSHTDTVVSHSAPQSVAEQIKTAAELPENAAGDTQRTGILYELLSGLLPETVAAEQTVSHGKRALEYIRNNYMHPICVGDVASAIGVSRSWLYRCFIDYTEQTPAMYLRGLRMERAKSLLRHTSLPVQEIACSVGFEDALYFSRVFSEYTGSSPTAYRNLAEQRGESV